MESKEQKIKYSAVIPVYNSASIVGSTIELIVAFFKSHSLHYEIILVNDGSRDKSWQILREHALKNPDIKAINLLRNYGQHTAVFCGLKKSTGHFVITLDDDLQNPPEEIIHLIKKSLEGHDVVFGQFRAKRHRFYRRIGSTLIGIVNELVFHKPKNLILSNFRIIRRDVVNKICAYKTNYPYITGLILMYAANPANVLTEHRKRSEGKSNYSLLAIARLCFRIIFNYSAYPLHLVSMSALFIALVSFMLGSFYLVRKFLIGVSVPGWATVVVLISFFNGIIIFILSMLGEYTVRLLQQMSFTEGYEIKETAKIDV